MWTAITEEIPAKQGLKYRLQTQKRPATLADVLHGWATSAEFREWFNGLLAQSPWPAFRWETPAATAASRNRPWEFALIADLGLDREPDASAFAEHLPHGVNGIATFANLSGDATLLVPCPQVAASAYGHLGAFVRLAPEAQCQALWQAVAGAMEQRIGTQPVWLSTAGAGVSWLHVRLDRRPKYYTHAPYRELPTEN